MTLILVNFGIPDFSRSSWTELQLLVQVICFYKLRFNIKGLILATRVNTNVRKPIIDVAENYHIYPVLYIPSITLGELMSFPIFIILMHSFGRWSILIKRCGKNYLFSTFSQKTNMKVCIVFLSNT